MYRFASSNLFVSSGDSYSNQSVSGGIVQLSRIQSIDIGLDLPSEDIQFLDANIQSVQVERPFVTLNYTYFPTNGKNERVIGFFTNITGNAIKKLNQEKNYYISYLENSLDYNLYSGNQPEIYKTIGLGNMLLDSWSLSASVGGFVTANSSLRGINLVSYTGLPVNLEAPTLNITDGLSNGVLFSLPRGESLYESLPLNPADGISALTAGDITLSFSTGSAFATFISGDKKCILQDFSFNLSLQRNQSQSLGSIFPDRPIQFPVEMSIQANAVLQEYSARQLLDLNCEDFFSDVEITMKQKCSDNVVFKLNAHKLRLKSQNMSQFLGGIGLVNVNFEWGASISSFGTGGAHFGLFSSQGNLFYELESLTNLGQFFQQEQIWKKKIFENEF
jgi:hypothetical protein